jgi:hypothetical protein
MKIIRSTKPVDKQRQAMIHNLALSTPCGTAFHNDPRLESITSPPLVERTSTRGERVEHGESLEGSPFHNSRPTPPDHATSPRARS